MAQTLADKRQTNRWIERHTVYLLPRAKTEKEVSLAQYCVAANGPPGRLPANHNFSAVKSVNLEKIHKALYYNRKY